MLKKWLFAKNRTTEDFSKFCGEGKPTNKQRLLEQCKKNDVSIYINDVSETSSGVYAALRSVASEAELEIRLNAKKALSQAKLANKIAIIAFIVSLMALIKSFY